MGLSRRITSVAAGLLAMTGWARAAVVAQATRLPVVLQCTPDSVSGTFGTQRTGNPVVAALRRAGPGSVIRLSPGSYPPFALGVNGNAPYSARATGAPGRPLRIEGGPGVRIRAAQGQDTILISQQSKTEYVHFIGLTIEPGWRAGVMFARGGVHAGFRFTDCHIVGSFNHALNKGRASKWGIWGSQLKDFVFEGVRARAEVKFLRDEHAFYLQNLRGDVRIENVLCVGVGRTFCQITARASEGAAGTGRVTIRDCVIRDPGLAPGDAHKGGSAITLGGRHIGTVLLERCDVRVGFNEKLKKLTRRGVPYGTGALVAVDGGERVPNGPLVVKDCRFEYAEGCGDRPVVSVGGVRELRLEGRNLFVAGGAHAALALDPPAREGGTAPKSRLVGGVSVSPETDVRGAVTRLGRKTTLGALDAIE